MKARIITMAVLATIVAGGCATIHEVVPADKRGKSDGVYYALPRTLVTVDVPLSRVEITTKDGNKTVSFKCGTPVIGTRAEPDTNQIYFVKAGDIGAFRSQTLDLTFNRDGTIARAETVAEDMRVDVVVNTIGAAAGIVAAAIKPGGPTAPSVLEEDVKNRILDVMSGRYQQGLTEVTPELYDKMLADLQSVLDGLEQVRDGVVEKKERTWVARFEILPEVSEGAISSEVGLFKFSKALGFKFLHQPINMQSGYDGMEGTTNSGDYTLNVALSGNASNQYGGVVGRSVLAHSKPKGFRYRIPCAAGVELNQVAGAKDEMTNRIARTTVEVAQMGPTLWLPSEFPGSKSSYVFDVFPETGALKTLNLSTTAYDGQGVKEAGAAMEKIVEASGKQAELERKKTILQLEKDIRELKDAEAKATAGGS